MKHKFTYLVGAVFILCCTTGGFTSCLEIDDSIDTAASGGGAEDSRLPKIGGAYFEDEDGDNELYMTYNGKVIKGRKVTLTPDEKNETAIFTLSGAEVDLSSMLGGLMNFTITPYSPIPGVKKLTITDVKLTPMEDGRTYSFEGSYDQVDDDPATYDDYRMSFKGTVKEGELNMNVQCEILHEDLFGTWGLDDVKTGGSVVRALAGDFAAGIAGAGPFNESNACSSLWIDWKTSKEINLGKVGEVVPPAMLESLGELVASIGKDIPIKGTPNKLIGVIFTDDLAGAIGANPENIVANSLRDAIGDRTGNMYFSYSYTGDIFHKPSEDQWGGGKEDELSNNIVRYYFDKKIKNRVYLEINPDFLLSAIGSLLPSATAINTRTSTNTVTSRAASKDETLELGEMLIEKLRPALEQGIPCDYTIDSNGKLQINIDGVYLRDVLRIIAKLANDPIANTEIVNFLNNDATLKDFAPTILKLINQLPGTLDDSCEYVKLGFKMHKTAELEPDETENPEPENPEPENPDPDNPTPDNQE